MTEYSSNDEYKIGRLFIYGSNLILLKNGCFLGGRVFEVVVLGKEGIFGGCGPKGGNFGKKHLATIF